MATATKKATAKKTTPAKANKKESAPAKVEAPAPAAEPTPKAEPAPATTEKKPTPKKPKAPGVAAKVTRPYLAGQIIQKYGLAAGVTPAMVAELDEAYGKPNPTESAFVLRNAWHSCRAYAGVAEDAIA